MRRIQKAESLKQQIYNLLKEDILNQRYSDGDVLNERKISEELQVSRTPVREALKALEAENWVEYVPYKGIIIKKMGERDIKNIFQIRTALEVLTVELAMGNWSENMLQQLEECHQQQKALTRENDRQFEEHFLDLDVRFHGILLEAANNELLTEMIGEIRDKIRRFGMNAIFRDEQRFTETLDEHLEILDAIRARDVERAKEKMKLHIENTYDSAYTYVTSQQ